MVVLICIFVINGCFDLCLCIINGCVDLCLCIINGCVDLCLCIINGCVHCYNLGERQNVYCTMRSEVLRIISQ
jgi:hypothetical protein